MTRPQSETDFSFFLAETTAHTLGATLSLLALHQDEQEKVHNHIQKVIPEDREAVSHLPKSRNCARCLQKIGL